MNKPHDSLINDIIIKDTRVYFTNKAYAFFKAARFRYRVMKTEGQVNQAIIKDVSEYFNIPVHEAGAILDGQIMTIDTPANKQFEYDRTNIENLFNSKESPQH